MVLAHGLLLFNQGVFWDDWLVKGFLDDGNWHLLRDMTSELGLPILAYFFGALKFLGLSDYYKTIALCLIFCSTIIIYKIGLQVGWISQMEALAIALVSAVYPAFQTAVLLTTLHYQFFYCIFLLAVLLVLISEKQETAEQSGSGLRWLALLLFFISFNLNSLLVFYGPFLALLFLHSKYIRRLSWHALAKFIFTHRAYFVWAPIVYWSAKKILFPTHGLYKNYNILDLNIFNMIARINQSLEVVVYYPIASGFDRLLRSPILWVFVFSGALFFYFLIFASRIKLPSSENRLKIDLLKSFYLLIFGVVLLICGILPYSAVRLLPHYSGWDTRHALLVGLPVSIIIVSLLRALSSGLFFRQKNLRQVLGATVLVIGSGFFVAFVASSVRYYVGWQARAIKDEAVIQKLEQLGSLKESSVFWIYDTFPVGGTTDYNFYEWSSVFKKIWGGQSRVGLQLENQGKSIPHEIPDKIVWTARYNLADFRSGGSHICLNIMPGQIGTSEVKMVRRYILLRIRALIANDSGDSRIRNFLAETTRVEAQILPVEERVQKTANSLITCGGYRVY